ncbi:uncharacterized protein LOC142634964 [Castanea sativa]|uniref:uncharacterized protein LOC142634964 n=1 Tax=Castanea sativa TaxID=21020 RepID=UPI003F64FCAA
MEVINSRGISQYDICPVCKNEVECLDHALLYCAFSSSVWNLWPENPMRIHGIRKSFLDSVFFILSHATLQDLELFFTIAWAIWSNKNRFVHEGSGLSPDQVWKSAKANAEDFACAVIRDHNGQVVAVLCKPLQACFFAELTEIMALEQGVLLAQEPQLPRIIVESDSSNAIQAIQENTTGSSFGHLI